MKNLDLFLEQMKQQAITYYKDIAVQYREQKQIQREQKKLEVEMSKEEKLETVIKKDTIYRWGYNSQEGNYPCYYPSHSQELYYENNKWLIEATNQNIAENIKGCGLEGFNEWIENMLTKEFARKKIALINRVEKKGGKVIDALELHYGVDSGINGHINCKDKIVEIRTIFAGGYNIQCLHYRVLVK